MSFHPLERKHTHLDIPGDSPDLSRPRPQRSPSQRFPPTLFQGLNSSRGDLSNNSPPTHQPSQRLPRAQAPPSLADTSVRPSVVLPKRSQDLKKEPFPQSSDNVQPFSSFGYTRRASRGGNPPNDDNFHPDALWAEMQRTLADVELSALNNSASSHVFGAAHSRALEDLRTAQLSLAQAWARSEADEINDDKDDTDIGAESNDTISRSIDVTSSPKSRSRKEKVNPKHRRRSSVSGTIPGRNLEEETERDIKLARKRREANDRYFQQVNQGVLDVVEKLDTVAEAMKRVERESREIWEDRSTDGNASNVAIDSIAPPAHLPTEYDFDGIDRVSLDRTRTRGTTGTATDSGTEALSDSPISVKKRGFVG